MSNREWKKDISLIYESSILVESLADQVRGGSDESEYELQGRFNSEVVLRMLERPDTYEELILKIPISELSAALLQHASDEKKSEVLDRLESFISAGGSPRLKKMVMQLASVINHLEKDMAERSMVSDFHPDRNE